MENLVKSLTEANINLDSQTAIEIARIWQMTEYVEKGVLVVVLMPLIIFICITLSKAVKDL